jgi:hypothetical protein
MFICCSAEGVAIMVGGVVIILLEAQVLPTAERNGGRFELLECIHANVVPVVV